MKALSVRQPWASLIASGRKTIELRSRPTRHRGPLLICAAQNADARHVAAWTDGPRGVAVCVVEVVDCRPATSADDAAACHPAAGLWAWVLADPRVITPRPVRGQLAMFDVDLTL